MRLDKLFNMDPKVVMDEVDPNFREGGYLNWRVQTLGTIALNLIEGREELNTANARGTHWADNYAWTRETADQMAGGGSYTRNQFGAENERKLAAYAGIELGKLERLVLPVGIVALRDNIEIPDAPDGFPGRRIVGPTGLKRLDPYSLAALQDMLEVPIH